MSVGKDLALDTGLLLNSYSAIAEFIQKRIQILNEFRNSYKIEPEKNSFKNEPEKRTFITLLSV